MRKPIRVHKSRAYKAAVDANIPAAEKAATERLKDHREEWGPLSEDESSALWTRFFHEEMQSLCEVQGLRKAGPRRVK